VSISPNQEQYLGWRGIEQVLSDAVTGVHSQLETGSTGTWRDRTGCRQVSGSSACRPPTGF
jgi:hypothetical protein